MDTEFFHFDEVIAGTPAYERYLEFRYQVFCEELHRVVPDVVQLSSNGCPIETDIYDSYSHHFMAYHKQTGQCAAFARLIPPNPSGLNVTPRYVIDRPLPFPDAVDENLGEISRMAVAPHFRRRHEDQDKPYQGDPEPETRFKAEGYRRQQPELVLGMYREFYRVSKYLGIGYGMAAMDHRFSRLLNSLGFPFKPVGPINETVQPPRRVFLISMNELNNNLSQRNSRLLDFFQT